MQPIRDCFPVILKEVARDPGLALVLMEEMWPQIVGPRISENLVPTRLSRGCLTLEARAEEWAACGDLDRMVAGAVNRFWGCRLVERIRIVLRQS